uniref:Uncharacterized protein n=1 Tax=Rhizophora mucronata TaxID=61149 RepID=A0A2P2R280_RHIMU
MLFHCLTLPLPSLSFDSMQILQAN